MMWTIRMARLLFCISISILVCSGCTLPVRREAARFAVAADHPRAIIAGSDILAAGGNAVDAAVAVSFTLAVVNPEDCGLGGGGFALYSPSADQEPVVVDFREEAPADVSRSMYLDRDGRPIPNISTIGAWAVGIPGQVRGAFALWDRYKSGRLTIHDILAPAIRCAEEGVPVSPHLNKAMQTLATFFRKHPEYIESYYETYRTFLREGEPYTVGEVLYRPHLAGTLKKIAAEGPDGFYRGDIGMAIAQETGRFGGPLTLADLAGYNVRWLKPLQGQYGQYQVYSVPPPSSGGAVLLTVLNVLKEAAQRGVDIYMPHLMAEAMKHAFSDRAMLLGDRSENVLSHLRAMLSPGRSREILERIHPLSARVVKPGGMDMPLQGGTSHFCVVDEEGGVVSWTESINLGFGSLITVPGTGIVLNNTMDDFALTEAGVNAFGLRQGSENLLRPGARPLSSMTPVIVYDDHDLKLAVGGSGGPKIISSVLHVVNGVLNKGLPLETAVRRGRYHQQWAPDVLFVEPQLDGVIIKEFLNRGHTIRSYRDAEAGCVQAIEKRENRLNSVSDPRKN